jgi:hypothetical protein
MIAKPAKKKEPIDWGHVAALAFQWAFIFAAMGLLVYLLKHAPQQGRLVCDSGGLRPSLTQFGTCHTE